jgi:hypothetical protein
MFALIAVGVVVSRGSPGTASFSSGSIRSSRVTLSPSVRVKAVRPCGTAEGSEQEIARRVVAQRDRGVAQLGERHAGGDMLLGRRRIGDEVLRVIADAPVELLLAGIVAREHGRAGEQLERAAQREALVGAMTRTATIARVQHRDAEPSAARGLDAGEIERLRGRAGGFGQRQARQRRTCPQGKSAPVDHPSPPWFGAGRLPGIGGMRGAHSRHLAAQFHFPRRASALRCGTKKQDAPGT